MSENLVLEARGRKVTGKKVAQLREQGIIPAVVYGHSIKPESLELDELPFVKVFKQAGESTLIDLSLDKQKPVKVLIQDVQYHPLTHKIMHVDFHQIKMTEKITTEVNLVFLGEAPAVKQLGGILVKNITALKVTCLPQDLIKEVKVDLTALKTLEDAIHVADLALPEKIELHNKPEETVVLVAPPRSEKEIEELAGAVEEEKAIEEVEVAGQKEKEEEAEDEKAAKESPEPKKTPSAGSGQGKKSKE